MEDRHRALEYETIRREMTDRLLWAYGLLPLAVVSVYGLLTQLPISIDPAKGPFSGALPVLSLTFLVSAFCFATRNILVNIYDSGSYLIVYHELELKSKQQYLLRSRFLPRLVRRATFRRRPLLDLHVESTGPTAAIFYLLLSLAGFALLWLRFGAPSPNFDISTIIDVVFMLLWLSQLWWLFDVKSTMEQHLLQYYDSAKIQNASQILDELAKEHCQAIDKSASSADQEIKA